MYMIRDESEVKFKPNKRSVIIVGASSGIGYQLAQKMLSRGYYVINISRTPCDIDKVKNYVADASVSVSLETAIKNAINDAGGIMSLVYCAGFSMASPLEYAKESDYRYLFEVNFFGALKALQTCIPFMKKGGKIIFISSVASSVPILFDGFYSASKSALDMLAKEAYAELAHLNIYVSSVMVGGTSTDFTFKRKVYSAEENKEYNSKLNKAVTALSNIEQGGMSPCDVADFVYKIFIESKPKPIYACGFKNKAYVFAEKIIPQKVAVYLTKRKFNQ